MNRLISIIFLFSFVFVGCDKYQRHDRAAEKKLDYYYTCSMHPKVKEEQPGKCPICHMNLTKVELDAEDVDGHHQMKQKEVVWHCKDYPDVTSSKQDVCPIDGSPMIKQSMHHKAGEIVGKVKLRKSQLSHFRPEFFPVTTMMMTKKIRLLGNVLQSEEKESSIPARIAGRIEKVYIKSTGSFVKRGDPIVDIYSPRLITAGEEYLIAKKSYQKSKKREFKEMLSQSAERLKLWGIKAFQYESWLKKGRVPKSITIYSSATGIVRKRNAIVGRYFKEGQNFFELSDLTDVWVEMDVYEQDASLVQLGQDIKMEFAALPGEIVEGEIDFIGPVLDTKSRTLKIRTTILNKTGKLKPGMVADATLELMLEGKPLVVPRTAIIDTGKRKVVWIKVDGKRYQAKTVHTGYESEGYVEIKHGLMEGEEVVMEGNFLLDAQAQLFGGYEDMKESAPSGHHH